MKQKTSNGNFTPCSIAIIDAAVTQATPAGASYHRTQASPLLANCCCHSSAPPELLTRAPTRQTAQQYTNTRTHTHNENQHKEQETQERENHEGEIIMGGENEMNKRVVK